jgi:phosphinothricin acetyltransferase
MLRLATSADGEPDATEMARRLGNLIARTPWLVAEEAGRVVGYAYASPHRDRPAYQWSVEVSACIDDNAHRAGHGRALYTALFDILTAQGFANAYAGITLPNPASVGFHRAMGFEDVGVFREVGFKFGTWHDVIWLQRPLAPRRPEMPAPRPLAEVLASRPLR